MRVSGEELFDMIIELDMALYTLMEWLVQEDYVTDEIADEFLGVFREACKVLEYALGIEEYVAKFFGGKDEELRKRIIENCKKAFEKYKETAKSDPKGEPSMLDYLSPFMEAFRKLIKKEEGGNKE